MVDEKLSLLDWIKQQWARPRWKRAVWLGAAGMFAFLGAMAMIVAWETGNGLVFLAAAIVFLILGLRIYVPEEPLPVIPEEGGILGGETAPSVGTESTEGINPDAVPAAAPTLVAAIALLAFLRIPLAVGFAVLAQYLMDVRPKITSAESYLTIGAILYGAAFIFAGWGLWAGDFSPALTSPDGRANGVKGTRQRFILSIGAAVFGLLAYATFTHGMFNVISLLLLLAALAYWLLATAQYEGGAFFALRTFVSSAVAHVRSMVAAVRRGIRLPPWTLLVVACFLGLVFLRTYNINGIPPGMTDDHAAKLVNVVDILEGRPYIFFTSNGGREPLEFYLIALLVQVAGTGISFLSLKIISIAAGIATLPFVYLLGKELADRRVGLMAMLLVGVGYWPDMVSRIGLRLPLAMLFTAATLYFFLRGLRRRRWNDFLWTGVALGIGMYGYTPIRVVPFLLAAGVLFFLLHPSSKGSRLWAVSGFLVTALTAVLLFIPMLRYALEFPNDFWLRTISRIVPEGGGGLPNPVAAFLTNLRDGMLLFNWNDGRGWFNCVPLRPALDILSGAFFSLGIFWTVVHFLRKRVWESLFLLFALPILILPSVLALAEPVNNPSLARANEAIPVAFLFSAIGLVAFLDYLNRIIPGRAGALTGAVLAAALMIPVTAQNQNLTQVQYPQVYRNSLQNESEIGTFIGRFVQTVGRYEDARFIPFPYWIGNRLVNIYAGLPIGSSDLVLWQDKIGEFVFSGRPTLFLLLAQDSESLNSLQAKFPNASWKYVSSAYPGKDFIAFLVPGTPGEEIQP